MKYKLKYLQLAQYESWLRKIDDPEWVNHRYRSPADNAMASAIRELRDLINSIQYCQYCDGYPCVCAVEEQPICKLCGRTFMDHFSLGARKVCYNEDPVKTGIITSNYFTR